MLAVGDVAYDAAKSDRLSRKVAPQSDRRFDVPSRSTFSNDFPVKLFQGCARIVNVLECLGRLLRMVRILVLTIVHPHQLFRRVTEESHQGVVEKRQITRQVDLVITIRDAFKNGSILLFALAQFRFCSLALGDVTRHSLHTNRDTVLVD